MPRRGPSKETFAAVVQLWVQRIHTVRDKLTIDIFRTNQRFARFSKSAKHASESLSLEWIAPKENKAEV